MNHTTVQSLENLYDNILTKTIATITYFLVETIGSFLYICIIHFERYGGDPQKRSFSNRFISFAAYFSLLDIWVAQSIYYYRVMFGCLPVILGEVLIFFRFFVALGGWSSLVISLIYKCMQIYAFHFTARLNDDIWSLFIKLFLSLLFFLWCCAKHHLGYFNTPGFKMFTCLDVETRTPVNNV